MSLTSYISEFCCCSNRGVIPGAACRLDECERMMGFMKQYCPQFAMDGIKNMWIVKPGAKSRGRGEPRPF